MPLKLRRTAYQASFRNSNQMIDLPHAAKMSERGVQRIACGKPSMALTAGAKDIGQCGGSGSASLEGHTVDDQACTEKPRQPGAHAEGRAEGSQRGRRFWR